MVHFPSDRWQEKGDKLTDWGCNNCFNDYFMFYHQTQETECDHLDNGILGCVSKPQRQKMVSITVHSNLHCLIGIPKQGNHCQEFHCWKQFENLLFSYRQCAIACLEDVSKFLTCAGQVAVSIFSFS